MVDGKLDKDTALLQRLLDLTLKLRYENAHMLAMITRLGMEPKFPEYQDHEMKRSA